MYQQNQSPTGGSCSGRAIDRQLGRSGAAAFGVSEGVEKSNSLVGNDPMKDCKFARWLSLNVGWLRYDIGLCNQCLQACFQIGHRQQLNTPLFDGWIMDDFKFALPRF